jgi:hypothetical protein
MRGAMSLIGPSRQILRWNLMSAFGVLRTSCQAGHQAHRQRMTRRRHQPRKIAAVQRDLGPHSVGCKSLM